MQASAKRLVAKSEGCEEATASSHPSTPDFFSHLQFVKLPHPATERHQTAHYSCLAGRPASIRQPSMWTSGMERKWRTEDCLHERDKGKVLAPSSRHTNPQTQTSPVQSHSRANICLLPPSADKSYRHFIRLPFYSLPAGKVKDLVGTAAFRLLSSKSFRAQTENAAQPRRTAEACVPSRRSLGCLGLDGLGARERRGWVRAGLGWVDGWKNS